MKYTYVYFSIYNLSLDIISLAGRNIYLFDNLSLFLKLNVQYIYQKQIMNPATTSKNTYIP